MSPIIRIRSCAVASCVALSWWSASYWRRADQAIVTRSRAAVAWPRDASVKRSTLRLERLRERWLFEMAPADEPHEAAVAAPEMATAAPRPNVVLTGIVRGRRSVAVIEGLPGFDGPQLIPLGGELGELRVVSLDAGRALIRVRGARWSLAPGDSAAWPP